MPANIAKPIALASKILSVTPAPAATPASAGSHPVAPPSTGQRAHRDKTPFQPKPAVGFDPPPSGHGCDAHGLQAEGIERVDLAAVNEDTCRGWTRGVRSEGAAQRLAGRDGTEAGTRFETPGAGPAIVPERAVRNTSRAPAITHGVIAYQ